MHCFFSNRKIRIFDQISDFSTKKRTLSCKMSRKTAKVTASWQERKLICRNKPQNKDSFRYTFYLIKVRIWLRLSHSVKIGYINELVVKKETWILHTVLGPRLNMRKIPKLGVTPVVEAT